MYEIGLTLSRLTQKLDFAAARSSATQILLQSLTALTWTMDKELEAGTEIFEISKFSKNYFSKIMRSGLEAISKYPY